LLAVICNYITMRGHMNINFLFLNLVSKLVQDSVLCCEHVQPWNLEMFKKITGKLIQTLIDE